MTIIEGLHPVIRPMAENFIELAKVAGIELRITAGMRNFAEQQKLYDQGRTTAGKIVTKAKPGTSYHNYGLAIDVVPIINKKAVWDNEELWKRIGSIGEIAGFEWGGRWKFVDKPHFQYPPKTKYTLLLHLKNEGKVDINGFVIL